MTDIGMMRRPLVLERAVDTPDDVGGVTRRWGRVARLWGAMERTQVSSNERDRSDRRELAMAYRVTLRWRGDITGNHRFRDGKRLFAVLSAADPDGHRRRLICVVEEVTP
ncbi:Head-tail adaptor [Hyphomicrobiales bacterium]|nr:Head-tail adaptor [Hyphomicrobiales bacterium]CAH1669718.1 Head-tail adaptor [Hyphomicrobiales bacterium]